VFTEPDGLPKAAVTAALHDQWGFTTASLEYQPVGFGSYHWLATDREGRRLWVTADDLDAKLRTVQDTTDDAFGRLHHAFGTALALHGESGLTFVVAPVPTAAGQAAARLSVRYSLVVHPHVTGTDAGEGGKFTRDGDRQAVVDMLIQLHRARAGSPAVDDFVVPNLDTLQAMLRDTGGTWRSGPYAQVAHQLLMTHAADLRVLISAYHSLARRVGSQPERMVITHGEPHSGNVMVTAGGLVLVDWDTTLLAPPERDLWDLASDDPALLDYYAAATGTRLDDVALSLYRLWYDLAEVGGYLSMFRSPHEDTADTEESWKNLKHFLQPAQRWPSLVAGSS
jgi:hypothetical protein